MACLKWHDRVYDSGRFRLCFSFQNNIYRFNKSSTRNFWRLVARTQLPTYCRFFFTGNEVITGSKPKIILLVFRLTFNLNHRVCYTMKLRNNMLIFVHWKPSEVNLSIPWEFAIDWISIKFMIQQIMRETTKSNARTSN